MVALSPTLLLIPGSCPVLLRKFPFTSDTVSPDPTRESHAHSPSTKGPRKGHDVLLRQRLSFSASALEWYQLEHLYYMSGLRPALA